MQAEASSKYVSWRYNDSVLDATAVAFSSASSVFSNCCDIKDTLYRYIRALRKFTARFQI